MSAKNIVLAALCVMATAVCAMPPALSANPATANSNTTTSSSHATGSGEHRALIVVDSGYASSDCAVGCVQFSAVGKSFYTGSESLRYRVCGALGSAATLLVDGATVEVPNSLHGGCVDVSGKELVLDHGNILYGRLP